MKVKNTSPVVSNEPALRKRVEFWASTMDAFLQEFLRQATMNDKLGAIVACARLAQLGAAIAEEYKVNCGVLVDSETEMKVAQQACSLTVDLINRNGEQCTVVPGEPSVSTRALDPSRN